MRSARRRKLKTFMIISMIFAVISLISLGVFSFVLLSVDVLPTKYLIIIYSVILIIYFLLFLASFKVKKKPVKIMSYIMSTLLSIVFIVGAIYLNNTNDFLKNTQVKDYDTVAYSVVTLKDNKYSKIDNLKNKTISYLKDDNIDEVKKDLESKIKYEEKIGENSNDLANDLMDKKIDAITLEDGYLAMLSEEIPDFESKTKVIYTFKVKIKTHKEEEKKIDVQNDAFIVYISGIDQYGSVKSVRGRSDVNQLAIINPTTHHILLLNTPRDYYVQLAGTTGLKDKLTHAGIYGIDKSIKTLENLYDIDISYYFRVNFNSLIKLVDTIGGIEVYSDTALTLLHDRSYHVKVGMNKLNGKQALAYSRERYGYASGDRHRGQNQQDVMKAIISKVTSSKVIISKYNSILNSMKGSFQTDMPTKTITSFIKKQVDEMPSWKIDTFAVDGTGSKQPTYSMGSKTKLYVMIPKESTIKTAKQKIKEIMEEN